MDALRLKRAPLRTAVTKATKALEDFLQAPQVGTREKKDTLAGLIAQLEGKQKRLEEEDAAILHFLQENKSPQEDYEKEFEGCEEYKDKCILCLTRATRRLKEWDSGSSRDDHDDRNPRAGRKYRLPEIELKKFGGEITDWLGFWGQFRKLHDDPEIDGEDKFQYLLQATVPGSKARQLVESFPPSAANYTKAIDMLRNRFGRDDALVEVYVRELLRLVLSNTMNPRLSVKLTELYDKLETQLRALETLGVTCDKYAAMLYPLVESCLPEDVLRVWERHRALEELETGTEPRAGERPSKMALLMSFLRREVEGEQRIQFARSGFGLEQEKRTPRYEAHDKAPPTSTAAGLLAVNQRDASGVNNFLCLFCDKGHATADCRRAVSMSYHLKRHILRRKNVCFRCLQFGHQSKACGAHVTCTTCGRSHLAVMCPVQQTGNEQTVKAKSSGPPPTTGKEQTLTNRGSGEEVLLQTLRVRVRGPRGDRVVRALMDTGSQRSYVHDGLMSSLGYESLGTQEIVHGLFGGVESPHIHHRYRVRLSSYDGSYLCNFEVFDQPKICLDVPSIRKGPWTREAEQLGLQFSDCSAHHDSDCSPDINILIGADVMGKLLTGRVQPLTSGPVAVETKLGWTLMGKIPSDCCSDSTMTALSLHVNDACISKLWSLDTLGIQDPGERQSKEDLQQAAMDHFEQTVQITDCGRYVVSLPWIGGHPPLPTNKKVAQARFRGLCKRLQADDVFQEYNAVLTEWLEEGIIEEVPLLDAVEQEVGHYLPHRAVIKEDSTTKVRPVFDASSKESGQPSLNDCLEKGPNLVELIPALLGRFRLHAIGVKTASGVLLRPIQRLYPMEIPTGEQQPDETKGQATQEDAVRGIPPRSATSGKADAVRTTATRSLPVPPAKTDVVQTRSGRRIKVPQRLTL